MHRPRSWGNADRTGRAVAALLLLAAVPAGCGQGSATGGDTGPTTARPASITQRGAAASASAARVDAATPTRAPTRVLSHPGATSRYAFVQHRVQVRTAPHSAARSLGRLTTRTPDGTSELVLVLRRAVATDGRRWLQVRTPLRPAGTVGWIPRDALSRLVPVHTWLVVDRRRLRARLVRDGRVVFRAPVAIGKGSTPTPPGRFYVRDKLTDLPRGSIYGPLAFGTSATSDKVTDWPGGSVVGVHGTNEPDRIPGRISHGCVRLRNADIRRLARVMPVGTPVTIR